MPTYDYKCDACGASFERFQSMMADPIRKCPVCGKNKVKRLIGAGAGLIFKGSGFYITDYRSDGYKSSAKSDSGTSAGTGGDGAKSSDASKPAESKPAASAAPAKAAPAASSGKASKK